jgi:4-hydroxy-tetrahydrodipicolinate reductase
MKIAIVGYGKMGRMIEGIALAQGHEISGRFDLDNNIGAAGLSRGSLAGVDVAIEFSTPETAVENIRRLVSLQVPTVVGTTGWYTRLDEISALVAKENSALVYGANFSIGMNIFFKITRYAAAFFARHPEYGPFLLEHHHQFKKDAPSGTALVIADLLRESYGDKTPEAVSIRAGYAPGTHEVGFDSNADTVTLTHTARSREGFAAGALLAAQLIIGKRGVYEFSDLLFEG